MKVLLFKISSCSTCMKQEELLEKYSVPYIPCELFENRELARKYKVTDTPTTVLLDNGNNCVAKYNFLLNKYQIEHIKNILANT